MSSDLFTSNPIDAVSRYLTKTMPEVSEVEDRKSSQQTAKRRPTAKQLKTLFGEQAGADAQMA